MSGYIHGGVEESFWSSLLMLHVVEENERFWNVGSGAWANGVAGNLGKSGSSGGPAVQQFRPQV